MNFLDDDDQDETVMVKLEVSPLMAKHIPTKVEKAPKELGPFTVLSGSVDLDDPDDDAQLYTCATFADAAIFHKFADLNGYRSALVVDAADRRYAVILDEPLAS
ncbi:hypothetical protein ACWGJ9_09305 [Curtobacterium citreum]